jgi:hypothetical protein
MYACIEADTLGFYMNEVLVWAIHHKRRLRFLYEEEPRLVEPQCYGIGKRGNELLRAYQLQGGPKREQLFNVSKIVDLEVLDEAFHRPGPNYKKNDSAMKAILAQL